MKREESRFADSNVFEGMVSFRALIAGIESGISDRKIEKVIYDKSRAKKLAGHLSYIKAMSYKHGFVLEAVDSEAIEEIAIGTSHGGVIVYATERHFPSLSEERLVSGGFYMMLDGIEDPYNFGYAMRSLYAAGVDGVILPERNWMSAAGVVCRASAGASEQVRIFTASADDAARVFKSAGYRVVCAELENSVSVYDAKLNKPILLCVGGEKRGLSKSLIENADEIVRLDYGRDFPQALSAASAASILAFEVLRNNRN
ncbi:MAG: RNA methyltransferase [Clostridia bacterium]|nr:RNA methyltransferase [Clostridia bacterium]